METSHRHEVTARQWQALGPLLPPVKPVGRKPANRRMVINGILWIERTGAGWRDLPRERYGPWETVYGWYNRWTKDGTWQQIHEALRQRLDRRHRIGWKLWAIDSTVVRAHKTAAGAGKKGRPRSRPITV